MRKFWCCMALATVACAATPRIEYTGKYEDGRELFRLVTADKKPYTGNDAAGTATYFCRNRGKYIFVRSATDSTGFAFTCADAIVRHGQ